MTTVSKSLLRTQKENILEMASLHIQQMFSYIAGQLEKDLQLIISHYQGDRAAAENEYAPAVQRIKLLLFGAVDMPSLLIPDAFFGTPLGIVIRTIENGYNVPGRSLTVKHIMNDMGWSRNWVIQHLYNIDDPDLNKNDISGKMAAIKTSSGFLVESAEYLLWKMKRKEE
ncbi:MAG: hypothetical protein JWM44_2074 [Bacilli bacterium]|nr:hypothetical protein [Bacilli bacterium]